MRAKEYAILAAAFLAVLIAERYSRLYYRNVVDDAATSMQYAKNFALGNGLVFNVGERVEGYTNFLWVVLEAPLYLLAALTGASFPTLVVHFTQLILAGIVLLVGLLVLRVADARWLPLLFALGLVVADNSLACWAVFGLETHLLGFLCLLALYLAGRAHPRRWLFVGLTLAAAHMTRPDAGLFCAVVVGSECVEVLRAAWALRRGGPRAELKAAAWDALRITLVWVGVYGLYFAWRYSYYGYPFPNTYYLKLAGEIDAWQRGWEYGVGFFAERLYLPLLALGAVVAIGERTARTLVVYLSLHTLYVIYVGGDFFSGHRFFVPEIPLFAVAIAIALARLLRLFRANDARLAKIGLSSDFLAGATASFLVLGVGALWQVGRETGPLKLEILAWRDNLRDSRKLMAWFKANAPPNATIATCLIGHTGLFSGLRVLDLCGVVDPVVAHQKVAGFGRGKAGHEKMAKVDYVLAKKPTYIVDGYLPRSFWSDGYYLSAGPPPGSVNEIWARDFLAETSQRVPEGSFDFDRSSGGFTLVGDAFRDWPAYSNRPRQGAMRGAKGGFLNSFHPTLGDRAVGTITSPSFQLVGDAMTLRVAGGIDRERLRASLVVDGQRVFDETGRNSDGFTRRSWDVRKYRGKSAVLEVVDNVETPWGYIAVDQVEQWGPRP